MQEKITHFIQELVSKLMLEVKDIQVKHDTELETTIFTVETDDPQLLIGRNGDVLRAVNHIVRRMVEEDNTLQEKDINFLVDVNGYHIRKLDEVKTKARIVADRARSFKSDVSLDPMSAYDRRIVHSYVNQFSDVATESRGEGRDRHVVIRYIG